MDPSKANRLSWESTLPAGTKVRMRARTAESKEKLEKAVWKDLTDSPGELAPAESHRWVQWRADLESDGRRTPVLRAVRVGS